MLVRTEQTDEGHSLRRKPPRGVGSFLRSGDWSDYWSTSVGDATDGVVLIRGYSVEDVIDNLSFVESTYLVIRGELPTKSQAQVFDLALRSTLEHGFVVAASCAARIVASAVPEAPAAAIGAGVLAHGSVTGSPQAVAEMLVRIVEGVEETDPEEDDRIEALITHALEFDLIIPGLGHPLHKEREPRAERLRKGLEALGAVGRHSRAMTRIHDLFVERSGKNLPVNVDGELAPALLDIGFTPIETAGIGILSFMPGIIAHTVEEIDSGVPLRYFPHELGVVYTGPDQRKISDTR
jgi:citrate synthase